MNAAEKILRELAFKAADDRAHRIATIAAEELVRSEAEATGAPDEYLIPQCQADDHMRECIQHLQWAGEAMSHETDDGYIVVVFQDLTLSSLAG